MALLEYSHLLLPSIHHDGDVMGRERHTETVMLIPGLLFVIIVAPFGIMHLEIFIKGVYLRSLKLIWNQFLYAQLSLIE